MMQQAARLGCAGHAGIEGLGIPGPIVGRQPARQDRLLAQQGIHLAGHVGGKSGDAAALHRDPFAVGAGQHQRDVLGVQQAEQAQRAEDLGFFAAHHVGQPGQVGAQAGHDGDAASARVIARQPTQLRCQIGQARRAGAVRRLDPALAAAHHAGHQAGQAGVGCAPGAEFGLEGSRPSTRRHAEQATRRGMLSQHRAVGRQQRTAQGAGAPIDRQQRGLHRSVVVVPAGAARFHMAMPCGPAPQPLRGCAPQWLSFGTAAPRWPTRKSRSQPWSACSTWSM